MPFERKASERLPAYVRPSKLAGGKTGYYWELPHWARPKKDPATGKAVAVVRHGQPCPLVSTPLGADLAKAIEKGNNLNEAFREWRTGTMGRVVVKGTVAWLFAWYRDQPRFKKNKPKTKKDYHRLMDAIEAFEPKKGAPALGKRAASKVDATVADKMYEKWQERGVREASYAMQVCRLVWSWAVRHKNKTGVTENPFLGMGLKSTAVKGNRATTRAEYDRYRDAARTLGYQSMATAAALCFECCQRVSDVFGYEELREGDAAVGPERNILWSGYAPGEHITLIQSKTGNPVMLPLFVEVPGEEGGVERERLYPELEDELAAWREASPAGDGRIIVEERSGKPYKERRMSTVHRAICDEAGLPKDMTFTGFRHGGITEIGDAGIDDPRAVSGHKTLEVTRIYNKANAEKARRIATARRAHVAQLGALDEAKAVKTSGED